MSIKILVGDCRATLKTLPEQSVQVVITSPPYYGLRKYSVEPLIWDGDPEHNHAWNSIDEHHNHGDLTAGDKQKTNTGDRDNTKYSTCPCGAWCGMLGNEPTPELFIQHLVECFREVKRVLRDDGLLWVNMGDSYSGSHGNGYKQSLHDVNHTDGGEENFDLGRQIDRNDGCKPGDLLEIPSMVALALRADGWYLRSRIPWLKKNTMPESVRTRPTTAVEYVFLLAKSGTPTYWTHRDHAGTHTQPQPDYCWIDAQDNSETDIEPYEWQTEKLPGTKSKRWKRINLWASHASYYDPEAVRVDSQRSRRNSDWFFESWQGLMLDEEDQPLSLIVNPTGYKDAHYATFSPKFVTPMLRSSTSERGCCPECGSPWTRVIERTPNPSKSVNDIGIDFSGGAFGDRTSNPHTSKGLHRNNGNAQGPAPLEVGWRASCGHELEPIPNTVLDCFGGAATVSLVADRLGRNGISCELSDDYSAMSDNRLVGDAPLFAQVEKIAAESEKPLSFSDYKPIPLFEDV